MYDMNNIKKQARIAPDATRGFEAARQRSVNTY